MRATEASDVTYAVRVDDVEVEVARGRPRSPFAVGVRTDATVRGPCVTATTSTRVEPEVAIPVVAAFVEAFESGWDAVVDLARECRESVAFNLVTGLARAALVAGIRVRRRVPRAVLHDLGIKRAPSLGDWPVEVTKVGTMVKLGVLRTAVEWALESDEPWAPWVAMALRGAGKASDEVREAVETKLAVLTLLRPTDALLAALPVFVNTPRLSSLVSTDPSGLDWEFARAYLDEMGRAAHEKLLHSPERREDPSVWLVKYARVVLAVDHLDEIFNPNRWTRNYGPARFRHAVLCLARKRVLPSLSTDDLAHLVSYIDGEIIRATRNLVWTGRENCRRYCLSDRSTIVALSQVASCQLARRRGRNVVTRE